MPRKPAAAAIKKDWNPDQKLMALTLASQHEDAQGLAQFSQELGVGVEALEQLAQAAAAQARTLASAVQILRTGAAEDGDDAADD